MCEVREWPYVFQAAARESTRRTCSSCKQQGTSEATHRTQAVITNTIVSRRTFLLNCALSRAIKSVAGVALKKSQHGNTRRVSAFIPPKRNTSPEVGHKGHPSRVPSLTSRRLDTRLVRLCSPYLALSLDTARNAIDWVFVVKYTFRCRRIHTYLVHAFIFIQV